MKRRITNFVMKIFIVLITLTSVNLYAAAKTWNGSVSTDWNTAANWTDSGVPGLGDDVTIPTSPTGGRMPTISSGTPSIKTLDIRSSAILTQSGGTLSVSGNTDIAGTFTQTSGTFSGTVFNVSSTGIVNVSGTFTTNANKITIDGGTFTQSGGTVTTKDMELKNSGTYNQSAGEFQIDHDLKVPVGATFNGSGGTVRFTGAAGAGAVYSGNVQFYNLIVNAGANYTFNANTDTIRVAGNYTNNNSSLENNLGTLILNGISAQTFYSASTKNVAANVIVSCPNVTLSSHLKVKTSFSLRPGGHVIKNGYEIYVNGVLYEGPTPVELVSFNVKVRNKVVLLDWKTATEVNNYGFEIERASSSTSPIQGWEKIGFVNGHGNSNSPKDYIFEDSKLSTNSYHYRLKQVDNDGTFSFSNSVSVSLNQVPGNFALYQNYPNPFNPTTSIKYTIAEESFVIIKIYNIIGSEIATLVNDKLSAGNHEINFDASSLSSGAYIYKIQAGNFSETKKMILNK
jgi:hypothetical protein